MAGRGPAPKPNSRTRHKPQRGEWVDLAPLEAPVLRELPEGDWRPEVVEIWEAWRADPVSSQWSEADVAFALDAIRMRNDRWPSAAAEIRLRMDSLGLTPKGKRDLRWRIAERSAEEPQRPAQVRRLRAVG